jgi:ankyrin repeat protein
MHARAKLTTEHANLIKSMIDKLFDDPDALIRQEAGNDLIERLSSLDVGEEGAKERRTQLQSYLNARQENALSERQEENRFTVTTAISILKEPCYKNLSPLHLLAKHGHLPVLNRLIEAKVDLNDKNVACSNTPLTVAASHNQYEVIRLLLDKKADLTPSAVYSASANGYDLCLALLLSKSADPNSRDDDNFSALHYAAMSSRTNSIEVLIDYNVDHKATTSSSSKTAREIIPINEIITSHGKILNMNRKGTIDLLDSLEKHDNVKMVSCVIYGLVLPLLLKEQLPDQLIIFIIAPFLEGTLPLMDEEKGKIQLRLIDEEKRKSQPPLIDEKKRKSQPPPIDEEKRKSQPPLIDEEKRKSQPLLIDEEKRMTQPTLIDEEKRMTQPTLIDEEKRKIQPHPLTVKQGLDILVDEIKPDAEQIRDKESFFNNQAERMLKLLKSPITQLECRDHLKRRLTGLRPSLFPSKENRASVQQNSGFSSQENSDSVQQNSEVTAQAAPFKAGLSCLR